MCGIVGYVGSGNAISKLEYGLKRLEYRGYDSAGVSFFCNKSLKTIKSVGNVDCLFEKVEKTLHNKSNGQDTQKINTGIGHTRWATHGPATENNSHPHQSEHGFVSLVHNGIIENYQSLKNEFLKNTKFVSDTDTEVVANLIEQSLLAHKHSTANGINQSKINFLKANEGTQSFKNAMVNEIYANHKFNLHEKLTAIKTVKNHLQGTYALAILFADDPERVFFAKQSSPLLIGTSKNGNFLASDVLGFDLDADKYIEIEDGQFGWISKQDVFIFDKNGNEIQYSAKKIKNKQKNADLQNFSHYMEKEINEIPESIVNTAKFYLSDKSPLKQMGNLLNSNRPKRIFLVACGTSFHASKVGEIWLRQIGFDATSEIASEFIYSPQILNKGTLCIFTSQSGETADTLAAARLAKKRQAKTMCITNVETSSLAKLCDFVLPIKCGPEIAVASTKAYNTQLCAFKILVEFLKIFYVKNSKISEKYSKKMNNLDKISNGKPKAKNSTNIENLRKNHKKFEKNVKKLVNFAKMINVSQFRDNVSTLIDDVLGAQKIFMVGKNFDHVLAMESALKLKEISYLSAEAYPSGELKHGTISLMDENSLIFAFATETKLTSKTMNIIEQVHSRGAKVVLISQFENLCKSKCICRFVKLPKINSDLYPILSIIPMQILAYKVSVRLGNNPDKPRNLAKSVTVE